MASAVTDFLARIIKDELPRCRIHCGSFQSHKMFKARYLISPSGNLTKLILKRYEYLTFNFVNLILISHS